MAEPTASVSSRATNPGLKRLKFCPFCRCSYVERLECAEHKVKCPFRSAFMYRIGNMHLIEAANGRRNFPCDISFIHS